MFSRAPVVHDLTIAFTIWGFLDAQPPAELVERCAARCSPARPRRPLRRGPALADMVPEATLRMTPQQVAGRVPGRWRELVGALSTGGQAEAAPGLAVAMQPEGPN